MSKSLQKLDQALVLARNELSALLADDLEAAQKLCDQRHELTTHALVLDDSPSHLLCERLSALQAMQTELHREASRQYNELKEQFAAQRQEGRRLNGYGKIISQTLH